ncbi:MAG: hypothetical protein ACOZIN_08435 [Myxococcota bacterium]
MGARPLVTAVVLLALPTSAKDKPNLDVVASARAYVYNVGFEDFQEGLCDGIDMDGERCHNASKPVLLTKAQLSRMKALLGDPRNSQPEMAMCWNPHHGLELLDREGKRIATVDICFQCDRISTELFENPGLSTQGARNWRAFFAELGLVAHLPPKKG